MTQPAEDGSQLCHLDRAWAATVDAIQGRAVDQIIPAKPAGNPNLTNPPGFYLEIRQAGNLAKLLTKTVAKAGRVTDRALLGLRLPLLAPNFGEMR